MPLGKGDQLGPYQILAPLGAGGMGEVYLAKDTRLGRDVAIKISAERFSERFEREARAIAALNHPNICTLFDVGASSTGAAYLVMENIDGETIAERIEQGPMPLEEALRIASQIADALDAAHEKGVTHRDLKPANIKIKSDGSVKVLDFGLAKLSGPIESSPSNSGGTDKENSPTMTLGMSSVGMIVGTAAYMSPEQARGKSVDKRADIWAFGVVLYEMLTGKRLFNGEDAAHTLASVIMTEPDYSAAPREVQPLLKRCLEKDPRKRLRDIGDAMLLVQLIRDSDGAGVAAIGTTPHPARSHSRLGFIVAGVFALAAVGLAFVHFREKIPETSRLSLSLLPPDGTTFDFANSALPALSPDGTRIVFGAKAGSGKTQLWVRRLDTGTAQPLQGTDDGYLPFWSPDSQYVGFGSGLTLKKIDVVGGPAVTVANLPTPLRGGTWNAQGIIVYSINGPNGLFQVSATGGTPTPASTFDAIKEPTGHRFPWFLPDGRHFLYLSSRTGDIPVLVGTLGNPKGPDKQVALANSNAIYADGQLLYLRDTTLMAQPFDPIKMDATGEIKPVAEGVTTYMQPSRVAGMTVSPMGLLVLTTNQVGSMARSQLVWMDRSGKSMGALGEPSGLIDSVELSPDQKSLAVAIGGGGASNLWIYDVARGVPTRFTFTANSRDTNPVWSPDGATLFWHSARAEQLFHKASNGTGNEQPLHGPASAVERPTGVSPDGKFLLYESRGQGATTDIMLWPLTASAAEKPKPRVVLTNSTASFAARFSLDGKWIAYASGESGVTEVYAAPFPGPGGKRQISSGGGYAPRWRRDGKEIFFIAGDGRLMAAEVAERNGALEIGKTQMLFGGLPRRSSENGIPYDVSADGKKFIVTQGDTRELSATPLTVLQNWVGLVKR